MNALAPRPRALLAPLAAAALAAAPHARAEPDPLRVSPAWDATIAGTAGALALVLALPLAAPRRCRACGVGELDETLREALVWRHPGVARRASDVLANGIIPAAALASSAASAWRAGAPSASWTDALVLAEVASVSTALDAIAKDAFARRRPTASLSARGAADESFYSGHTSTSFALAVGTATVAELRGYPDAPWVWAAGLTLASSVGYLRIAGDAHWTTDVLAGAAAGGLVGFAVPWLLHRNPRARRRIQVGPAPGGLALAF